MAKILSSIFPIFKKIKQEGLITELKQGEESGFRREFDKESFLETYTKNI